MGRSARQRGLRYFCVMVVMALLLALAGTSLAVRAAPTINLDIKSVEVWVYTGTGWVEYASYTYNGTAYERDTYNPLITLYKDSRLSFTVLWEVKENNALNIEDGTTFSFNIDHGGLLAFDAVTGDDLKDTKNEVLGEWSVANAGNTTTISGKFNAAGASKHVLFNGFFTFEGAANGNSGDMNLKINGKELGTYPVKDPAGSTNMQPLGPQPEYKKTGFGVSGDKKTINWNISVGMSNYQQFFQNQTMTPLYDVVIEDTLMNGQTLTDLTKGLGLQAVLYVPHYNSSNTDRNGEISNYSLGYLGIKSLFKLVEGADYSDPLSFKNAVRAQAPAYGVYGGTYIVVALPSLCDGNAPDAITYDKVLAANGKNLTTLISDFETTYFPLDQWQKDQMIAAYGDNPRTNGGLMSIGVHIVADASNVPQGAVENTMVVSHEGNVYGSHSAQQNYRFASAGVMSGQRGRAMLYKTDASDGSVLENVGFELYKWNDSARAFQPYTTTTQYTNVLGQLQFSGLPDGRYKIVETSPLPGYSADAEYSPSDEFDIDHQNDEVAVTVHATNALITTPPGGKTPPDGDTPPTERSPQTGDGSDMAPWVLCGGTAALGLALCVVALRRRFSGKPG